MEVEQRGGSGPGMKLLFVEMGVGYDLHGQDVTAAAMRACRDAIASNSIPAFGRDCSHYIVNRLKPNKVKLNPIDHFINWATHSVSTGSIPGVTSDHMKLHVKLGVPHPLQKNVDKEKIKSVFPYGKIQNFEIVDGGLVCSTEELAEKKDDCYIVNAAVYVGY